MRSMRGGRSALLAPAVAVLLIIAAQGFGDPVSIEIKATDFAALGGNSGSLMSVTDTYNYNDVFTGTVTSEAFQLTSGDYAGDYVYLYQADNDGPSVLENLGISPIHTISTDGNGKAEAGYLTANLPAAFLTGGGTPLWMTYDAGIPTPLVSCNYPGGAGSHVPAGDHTVVIYLVSPHEPTVGEIYVIDSGVAAVKAVVPVPEPLAAGLLILGSVLTVLRRRRIISTQKTEVGA